MQRSSAGMAVLAPRLVLAFATTIIGLLPGISANLNRFAGSNF